MILVDDLFVWGSYHGPLAAQARANGERNGHRWAHMWSDTSLEELDAFAQRCGLRRSWRDRDHYDLTPNKRRIALELGAAEASHAQLRAWLDRRPRP